MEFPCQESGCLEKAKQSCVCDSKVMFCHEHFIDTHLKFPGNHSGIKISDQIKNFYSKIKEAYERLEMVKNLLISKGDLMINQIGSAIKKNLQKILLKENEIAKISIFKNDLREEFNFLEKIMIIDVEGDPLDTFEDIIKNYIRLHSNCEEIDIPTIQIKKI
jgi:hypothetical protein